MMKLTDWLAQYYRKQADSEQRRMVLSLLEHGEDARLLDLGCGDGAFTLEAGEAIGTTRAAGGIEIVESNIAAASEKGIEVFRGNLEGAFPVESSGFDVVLANQVIEHVSNTDGFIREIHRVLKPGGYAVICTPNLAAVHNILFLLVARQPQTASVSDEYLAGTAGPGERRLDAVNVQPSHRRIFTPGALKGLLEYHGFHIDKSAGSGYFPLPAWLARPVCVLDKRHATHMVVKARKPRSME